MTQKFKVALVDDHALFRQGLELMFRVHPQWELIVSAASAKQFFEELKDQLPDVFLLDINLPKISGIEIAQRLLKERKNPNILFLTSNHAKPFIEQALKAGGKGFLTKEADQKELFMAIEAVCRGEHYFGKDIEQKVFSSYIHQVRVQDDPASLTERETEVVRAFAQGKTYQEVADTLNISKKTVESHRKTIFEKLGFQNQTDLIKYALKERIIEF